MSFRENLKEEMVYQDIKTKELAQKSGISRKTLDNYLLDNGTENIPSAINAVKIAEALNVTVEYLVNGRSIEVADNKTTVDEISDMNKKFIALPKEFRQIVTDLINALSKNIK